MPSDSIDPAFQPARLPDIPSIQSMAREIWFACYPGLISTAQIEYMLHRMYSSEALARDVASGISYEFITVSNQPAGYLAFEFNAQRRIATLHKLYLQPVHHGKGLAQAALRHVQDLARAQGLHTVQLRVNKMNTRAIRAYLKAGFDITSSLCADIGGGYVMDDHVMSCPIQPL